MKKRSPVGIISVIVFVALLFIPSYIAIGVYNKTENAPPDVSSATYLKISDLNGTEFSFSDTDEEQKKMIDLFSGMINSAERIDELPVNDGTECYLVSFKIGNDEKLYQFYFSKTGDSYMVDKEAKVFRISTESASEFLASPYASSLYTVAVTPTLTFNEGAVLLPNDIRWNYRAKEGGDLVEVDPKSLRTSSIPQSAVSDGSFDLNFSILPNRTYIVVTDENGKELFSGAFINDDLSKFSNELKVTESGILSLTVEAEWNQSAELDYSGKAKYQFSVDFSAPAEFSLGESSIIRGGIVILNAKNAKNADKITFTSSPALTANGKEITPVFHSDGKNSKALIMIDYTTENTEYTFTVSYGAVTQTLTLKVGTRTYRTGYESSVNAAIAQAGRSAAALSAFDNIIKGLVSKTSSTQLWSGRFGITVGEANPSYALGFGHSRTITSTGETYVNEVVDYYVAEGSNIYAAAAGKVIYTGVLDYPGKFVVIDHGLGLFTVYMHLADYSVATGDNVTAGAVIGTAGTSGFIANPGANHSIMYVQNGYPFCGYELEEKGIPGSN